MIFIFDDGPYVHNNIKYDFENKIFCRQHSKHFSKIVSNHSFIQALNKWPLNEVRIKK